MDQREEYFGAEAVYFSSNEMIASIKLFDATVEIIGYVDEIGDIQIVGTDEKKVFKFYLRNDTGCKIQIKAWDDQIQRILPHIKSNYILHLDGVASRPIMPAFNKGTEKFELVLQSNTIINCFGIYKLEQLESGVSELPIFNFENVGKAIGKIRIQGFVKTSFNKAKDERTGNFKFVLGSITDGVFKLEVRIRKDDDNNIAEKGEKIECKGVMHFEGTTFLSVETIKDIVKIPGETMSLKKVYGASEKIKRFLDTNENGNQIKKIKNV